MKKTFLLFLLIFNSFTFAQDINSSMSLGELKKKLTQQIEIIKYNLETYRLMEEADLKKNKNFDENNVYDAEAPVIPEIVIASSSEIKKKSLEEFKKISFKSLPTIPYTNYSIGSSSFGEIICKSDKMISYKSPDYSIKKIFYSNGEQEEITDPKGKGEYQKNLKPIDRVEVNIKFEYPVKINSLLFGTQKKQFKNLKNEFIQLLSLDKNSATIEISDGEYSPAIAVYGIDKQGNRYRYSRNYTVRKVFQQYEASMKKSIDFYENLIAKIDAENINPANVVNIFNKEHPEVSTIKQKKEVTYYFPKDIAKIECHYITDYEVFNDNRTIKNKSAPDSHFSVVKDDTPKKSLYGIVDEHGAIFIKPEYYSIDPIEGLLFKVQKNKDDSEEEFVLNLETKTFEKTEKPKLETEETLPDSKK